MKRVKNYLVLSLKLLNSNLPFDKDSFCFVFSKMNIFDGLFL